MPVEGKNSLMFEMGADMSGLASGAQGAIGIISNLASKVAKINPFAALAAGALAVFAQVASAAFNFAKNYEVAMLEVQTISAATRADFSLIKSSIFRLSKETLDDPIKLAKAYYQIVSAGYDGAEGLRLLEVASKAAVAGVTTTEVAADGITTVMNAFKVSMEDVDTVADAMFKTVELGKTTFDQLAAKVSQVAPMASAMGVSFQEVFAAVASLTKQGVPTAQAMTQIRAALIGVNDTLGDGWSEVYTLQEAFNELNNMAGGSQIALRGYVESVEAVGAIVALAGDNAKGAAEDLKGIEDAAGSAAKGFSIMAEGQISQMEILRNRIRAVTEGLGEELLSYANAIAGAINDLTEPDKSFSSSLAEQEAGQYALLKLQIEDSTSSLEKRKEIYKQLQSQYPAFFDSMEFEGELTDAQSDALVEVNNQLKLRIQYEQAKQKEEAKGLEYYQKQQQYEQKKSDILAELKNVRDAEYESRKAQLEDVYGRELSWLEKVDILQDKAFNNRYVGIGIMKGELRTLNMSALDLSKSYKELAKDTEILAAQMAAFSIPPLEQIIEGGPTYAEQLEAEKKKLNEKKALYETYEAYVVQFGKKAADERYENQLNELKNFEQYLTWRISAAKSGAEKEALAMAAGAEKALTDRKKEKYLILQQQGTTGELETRTEDTIDISVLIDKASIIQVEQQLQNLTFAWKSATDERTREGLAALMELKQAELDTMKGLNEEQKSIWDTLVTYRKDLSNRMLADQISKDRKAYRAAIKEDGKFSEKALESQSKLRANQDALTDRIISQGEEIAGIFDGIGDIFSKLGDDETGAKMNQIGEVIRGTASLAAGIATGDPMKIVSGAIDFIKAGLTVKIVSDTKQFEDQIKILEKAIKGLDYAIAQSVGLDRVSARKDAIDQLAQLEEAAKNAEEAEAKARKEVKFLGIGLGDKGEGSGTDVAKLEEFQNQAEEARKKLVEIENQLDELYTGTTQSSIVDSIVSGFEAGKNSAADFADDFGDLMRKAIVESLKIKYLEKAVQGFFEEFADKADSDGRLDTTEIGQLQDRFNNIITQSNAELNALNQILDQSGIAGIGADGLPSQGLSGEIKTVTEDTANILAGTLNKIMLDVAQGLEVGLASLNYLAQLNERMASLVDLNEQSNVKLTNIEKALS